ncbi:unnamed protein product [Pylaiella littoralis]
MSRRRPHATWFVVVFLVIRLWEHELHREGVAFLFAAFLLARRTFLLRRFAAIFCLENDGLQMTPPYHTSSGEKLLCSLCDAVQSVQLLTSTYCFCSSAPSEPVSSVIETKSRSPQLWYSDTQQLPTHIVSCCAHTQSTPTICASHVLRSISVPY